MPEKLTPSSVSKALETAWIGRNYLYLPETESTNDLLKQDFSSTGSRSLPDGTVLLTDFQKRGRGRMNRSWQAPAGSSLLFSLLLRPNWPADRITWLTMISGLAVSEAVTQVTKISARIKWPNDGVVSYEGSWHKFCGILPEGNIADGETLVSAVIGIGVNVNIPLQQLPEFSFPATSLLIAGGKTVSRLNLLTAILARFEHHYQRAMQGYSPYEAWQDRLIFLDKQVVVSFSGSDGLIVGTVLGANNDGQLLIRDSAGAVHHIVAGDVTLREYLLT